MEQSIASKNKRSELLKNRTQVVCHMMAYENVVCVSIGPKKVGDNYTTELAYKVYVTEKLPLSSLPKDQHIPEYFKGFPTDVVEMF
tara:strand:- start:205 stop:462 length:258 start_codon:yes stop_codon:yes gene_type:complete